MPYNQQLQVLYAIADALPRLSRMEIDSRGNGSYIGEATFDKYGALVERLMPIEGWYRDNMSPYKAAFEDGIITEGDKANIVNLVQGYLLDANL